MSETQEKKSLRLEILDKLSTLVTAGFGLVAALAWNDAIQSFFQYLFPEQSTIIAKFVYAVVITGLIVLVTTKLGQLIDKVKREIHH